MLKLLLILQQTVDGRVKITLKILFITKQLTLHGLVLKTVSNS